MNKHLYLFFAPIVTALQPVVTEHAGHISVIYDTEEKFYQVDLYQPNESNRVLGQFSWSDGWKPAVENMLSHVNEGGWMNLQGIEQEFNIGLLEKGDPVRMQRALHAQKYLTNMLTQAVNPTGNQDHGVLMASLNAFLLKVFENKPFIQIESRRYKEDKAEAEQVKQDEIQQKKIIATRQQQVKNTTQPVVVKPTWQRDADATSCNDCKGSFSMMRRRHHCRKCGKVFCAACCHQFTALPNKHIITPHSNTTEEQECCSLVGGKRMPPVGSTNVRVCNHCLQEEGERLKRLEALEKNGDFDGVKDVVDAKAAARRAQRDLNETKDALSAYQANETPEEWTITPTDQLKLMKQLIGKACVVKGHRCGHSNGLKNIHKIDMVENSKLWGPYNGLRNTMADVHTTLGGLDLIGNLSILDDRFKVRQGINEAFFFHGTSLQGAIYIKEGGFLPNLSQAGRALYGAGTYFSRESCKVLDYAPFITRNDYKVMCKALPDLRKSGRLPAEKDVVGKRAVIISRVILGEPNIVSRTNDALTKSRLPPIKSGATRYDSNMARTGEMPGHWQDYQAHGEFVVFNPAQTCPVYILWVDA